VVDQQILQASNHWCLAAHAYGGASLVLVCLLALELWSAGGKQQQEESSSSRKAAAAGKQQQQERVSDWLAGCLETRDTSSSS
jgi:hypothetical protein